MSSQTCLVREENEREAGRMKEEERGRKKKKEKRKKRSGISILLNLIEA